MNLEPEEEYAQGQYQPPEEPVPRGHVVQSPALRKRQTLHPTVQAAGELQYPRYHPFEAKGGRVDDDRVRCGLERGCRAFGVLAVALFHRLPNAVELGLSACLVRPPARPLFGGGREVYLQLRVR